MKKIYSLLVALFLIVAPLQVHTFAASGNVDVLALGDSLAYGINEKGEFGGKGYADYLALTLGEKGVLGTFNKGFSVPGYKTTNIISDLDADVEKESINYNYEKGAKKNLKASIKDAEIITLSIGANDVLANVKDNKDGTFSYDLPTITTSIQNTASNIDSILKEIRAINPEVTLVFMGYYNPYPHNTNMTFTFNSLVSMFDSSISNVVTKNGGTFVKVSDALASDVNKYIPNPANIHLSEAGYQVVASLMVNSIDLTKLYPQPGTDPNFTLPSDVKEGYWGAKYIEQAIKLGIFKGYGDGTFKPNKAISRVEITSILTRTFKFPTTNEKLPFKDVEKVPAVMVAELQAAYAFGVVKGDNLGNFNPNDHITREQFAQMLLRVNEKLTNTTYTPQAQTPFKDISKLSAESIRAIQFLNETGLVVSADKFYPKNSLSRAEAAKILTLYKSK